MVGGGSNPLGAFRRIPATAAVSSLWRDDRPLAGRAVGAPSGLHVFRRRTRDELWLTPRRPVVGVDQRRLEVTVAYPFLERSHRLAHGCHARPKRVTEVVEAHLANARGSERALEPA